MSTTHPWYTVTLVYQTHLVAKIKRETIHRPQSQLISVIIIKILELELIIIKAYAYAFACYVEPF